MADEEEQNQQEPVQDIADTQAPSPPSPPPPPPQAPAAVEGVRNWTYGLFGCFGDCKLCIITYVAPCYTAGKNAEAVGESCAVHALFALIPIANILCGATIREKIRDQKGIAGTKTMDCLLHCICPHCAYIQEGREVADNQVNLAIERY